MASLFRSTSGCQVHNISLFLGSGRCTGQVALLRASVFAATNPGGRMAWQLWTACRLIMLADCRANQDLTRLRREKNGRRRAESDANSHGGAVLSMAGLFLAANSKPACAAGSFSHLSACARTFSRLPAVPSFAVPAAAAAATAGCSCWVFLLPLLLRCVDEAVTTGVPAFTSLRYPRVHFSSHRSYSHLCLCGNDDAAPRRRTRTHLPVTSPRWRANRSHHPLRFGHPADSSTTPTSPLVSAPVQGLRGQSESIPSRIAPVVQDTRRRGRCASQQGSLAARCAGQPALSLLPSPRPSRSGPVRLQYSSLRPPRTPVSHFIAA